MNERYKETDYEFRIIKQLHEKRMKYGAKSLFLFADMEKKHGYEGALNLIHTYLRRVPFTADDARRCSSRLRSEGVAHFKTRFKNLGSSMKFPYKGNDNVLYVKPKRKLVENTLEVPVLITEGIHPLSQGAVYTLQGDGDAVCWLPAVYNKDEKKFLPIRSSELCCKWYSYIESGKYLKLTTRKRFFVDCLLETAPYGLYEYTPKEWFPPSSLLGTYNNPILPKEDILIRQLFYETDVEYLSSLLDLPVDVITKPPEREKVTH